MARTIGIRKDATSSGVRIMSPRSMSPGRKNDVRGKPRAWMLASASPLVCGYKNQLFLSAYWLEQRGIASECERSAPSTTRVAASTER